MVLAIEWLRDAPLAHLNVKKILSRQGKRAGPCKERRKPNYTGQAGILEPRVGKV